MLVLTDEKDFPDPEKSLEQQSEEAIAKMVSVPMACGCPALVDPSGVELTRLISCIEHTPKPPLSKVAELEGKLPLSHYVGSIENHLSQYGPWKIVLVPQLATEEAAALAQNPATPTQVLEDVFNDYFLCAAPGDSVTLRALAQNPNSSARVLGALRHYFPQLVEGNPAVVLLDLENPAWNQNQHIHHLARYYVLEARKKIT